MGNSVLTKEHRQTLLQPPPGWQTPAPSIWWARRWGWKVVGGEYVKMVYYWTKY